MAISNHERVGKALDLLKAGLRPYFEREMRAQCGDKWMDEAANAFRDGRLPRDAKGAVNWDAHALLSVNGEYLELRLFEKARQGRAQPRRGAAQYPQRLGSSEALFNR